MANTPLILWLSPLIVASLSISLFSNGNGKKKSKHIVLSFGQLLFWDARFIIICFEYFSTTGFVMHDVVDWKFWNLEAWRIASFWLWIAAVMGYISWLSKLSLVLLLISHFKITILALLILFIWRPLNSSLSLVLLATAVGTTRVKPNSEPGLWRYS